MHGNSSSRLEGLSVLSLALTLGATLFAFDFAGSGQSDGDYVSLGVFEKEDLQVHIFDSLARSYPVKMPWLISFLSHYFGNPSA